MSDLKKKDIKHVAKLANLPISDHELDKYTDQLATVVDYISELDEVDTEGLQPTSQTTGLENITRDDRVNGERTLKQKKSLSQSDNTNDGYFSVPMILKSRDLK